MTNTRSCVRALVVATTIATAIGCGSDGAQGPAGPAGPAGSNGGDGTGGTGGTAAGLNITSITPNVILAGRDAEVLIGIAGANFESAPVVDLGPQVTLDAPALVNPSTVRVLARSSRGTPTGLRDVKVTYKDKVYTATKSMRVNPTIRAVQATGAAVQGGLVRLNFLNEDQIPFDTSTMAIVQGEGFSNARGMSSLSSTDFDYKSISQASFHALVDALAPEGNLQVALANYAPGDPYTVVTSFYSAPDVMKATARAATPLAFGTPLTNQSIAAELETKLYKITAPTAGIVSLNVTGTGADASPAFFVLPKSGKAARTLRHDGWLNPGGPLAQAQLPAAAGDEFYVVVTDAAATTGADGAWSIAANTIAATEVAEQATAHDHTAPQVVAQAAGPFVLKGGTVDDAEEDVYEINLPGASKVEVSVNSSFANEVTVSTTPGGAGTNIVPAPGQRNATAVTPNASNKWYVHLRLGGDFWFASNYTVSVRPIN